MSAADRLATPDDAAELAALRVMMQSEIKGAANLEETFHAQNIMQDYFVQALQDHSLLALVAVREGKIVSTNGVAFYRKPPALSGGTGLVGYVTNVYTLPDWRGKGIATGLFRLMLEHATARAPDKLHLGATEMGLKIYERCGFKPPSSPVLEMRLI